MAAIEIAPSTARAEAQAQLESEWLKGAAPPALRPESPYAKRVENLGQRLAFAKAAHSVAGADDDHPHYQNVMAKARKQLNEQLTVCGVTIERPDVLVEIQRKERERVAIEGRDAAAAFQRDVAALEQELRAKADASQTLRITPAATQDGQRLSRLLEIAEREEARRRFDNRPFRELREEFERTSDADGPAFIAFIEAEYDAGWPWPTLAPQM